MSIYKLTLFSIFCLHLFVNTYAQPAKTDTIPSLQSKTATGKHNKVLARVTVDTTFSGGDIKWREYILNNINAAIPLTSKAPTGIYTVVVQFITDKQGNVSDVRALTNHGYGMEAEVVRSIKKKSKWTPATENERTVKEYGKVKVTFEVIKERKRKRKD